MRGTAKTLLRKGQNMADVFNNLAWLVALVVCVPVVVYVTVRLATHAILKTRQDFNGNGGQHK